MHLFPFSAQSGEFGSDYGFDASQLARFKPIALPHSRRSVRTMQIKNRVVSAPADMDVCRAVIVKVDRSTQSIEAQDSWHSSALAETQALGYAPPSLGLECLPCDHAACLRLRHAGGAGESDGQIAQRAHGEISEGLRLE